MRHLSSPQIAERIVQEAAHEFVDKYMAITESLAGVLGTAGVQIWPRTVEEVRMLLI